MYQIDVEKNEIVELPPKKFGELNFKEREHLQEWIAKCPGCLGEELLIIQKEFDGFDETKERLDLLALDKQGGLVVIENKLDDSGKDVVWQALKYASYCSSLSKSNILEIYQDFLNKQKDGRDAKERICEFLDTDDFADVILNAGIDQRLMLVAANFRREGDLDSALASAARDQPAVLQGDSFSAGGAEVPKHGADHPDTGG